MRLLVSVLLVSACYLACARAYPAMDSTDESDEKSNVDTVLVLPGGGRDMFGRPRIPNVPDVTDFDGDDSDESSWSIFRERYPSMYFDYVRQYLQELMNRFRDQMRVMASRFPSDFGFVGPWKIPEGANRTSTTKIIDGHVVTINETVYSDSNDTDGMFIRVRVFDIKPQNETTLTSGTDVETESTIPTTVATETDDKEEVTTPMRSVETVEDLNNEIPGNQRDVLTA